MRKELHQYPELSGEEVETAARIKGFISKFYSEAQFIENIGGNGLVAIFDYGEGKTVMIRCELDALPISEENEFEYKSNFEGVSHKCGHDGHMAIVAGLIFNLKEKPPQSGKVVLVFQPAEETGFGAKAMWEDERLANLNPDYAFALHNIPGKPMGSVITTPKFFSATVQSLAVNFKGKECHASEPENGINPTAVITQILTQLEALNNQNPKDEEFALLTPVHVKIGERNYGISPASGEVHLTLRTWSVEGMKFLEKEVESILKEKSGKADVEFKFKWLEYFPATLNDDWCANEVKNAATEAGMDLIEQETPFRFGEDFGWFSQHTKAAMFGLGAGINTPALHHADYDFPDEIIENGITMFSNLIYQALR